MPHIKGEKQSIVIISTSTEMHVSILTFYYFNVII